MTRIECANKPDFYDAEAHGVKAGAIDLGMQNIEKVYFSRTTYLEGEICHDDKVAIAEKLLADLVTQEYAIDEHLQHTEGDAWSVEITFNRGVTDMVAETTLKGIHDLGITGVRAAKTARQYVIIGALTNGEKEYITQKLLMNKVNEHVVQQNEHIFADMMDDFFELVHVPIRHAGADELQHISKRRDLYLNLTEMLAIQAHFQTLGREPTDVELEMLAQTWSEHCSHKSLTGLVEYNGEIIDNPLKQTIFRVTQELNKPWCLSVFKDNAGVISFDNDYAVCFKVETHNHPSAMEPYGGANTGIGGVIRDPLGTGLGAKPVINTDVFCFGPVDLSHEDVPKGVLHPKRVMQGVVAGVRDYGNRMGIPTSNGALFFDERYLGNPLVFCGNVGILPRNKIEKTVVPGDYILVVGGRTGRDGIHGATASSGELHTESEETWSGAVQIGNPIVEKKLVDTLMQARDRGLYRAITDCGAGGLSSAVGELAEQTGAEVNLEKVPLKYHGLTYMEIWISEAQERMVIFVPPEKLDEALKVFSDEDVEATVIGKTTNDKKIRLKYNGQIVGELDMHFLHNGLPRITRQAVWQPPIIEESVFDRLNDPGTTLHKILASPNVCSKEWVIRQYDHEVQAGSVLKPLVGINNDGPGDASITRPRLDSHKAVILSNGFNPLYGLIDPYWMAASAIDEALRNIIAVGGTLQETALLDNFCWGNLDKPDRFGGLLRAAQACYDMAKVFETPFISGKDSLNNEYQREDGDSIAIPPTLLISALSVMPDARKAISTDLKKPGNLLYIAGVTKNEMGGSHFFKVTGQKSANVPTVDPVVAKKIFEAVAHATSAGLVRSCHDCSEGGLATAIAEMAFAGGHGAVISLKNVPGSGELKRDDFILFSESNSRFIMEIEPEHTQAFEEIMHTIPCAALGKVTNDGLLAIIGRTDTVLIKETIDDLKESWQKPLRW
ncbi:phosphoribosylformylglycinamidine synthase subunit PurL [candidate division KSB1 bacterium]|nr:phosphoribosylformylglycinamidine synthase subunit PurL [candidate division KSB1 bacterium]RQW00719.1 MAG: phosphoribosylformylglycinamidine synthase subunit PurL [candidate division KSB1 bacterium]